jgi:outer membrane receptor protein involved in Fe transport
MLVRRRGSRVVSSMSRPRTLVRLAGALALGAAAPAPAPALAQQDPAVSDPVTLAKREEIVVRGRDDSMIGAAESASEGVVGAAQLEARPLARPGEVLETVPGMIATQHSGAGKANQYFLRGFNLDHGTDFATFVDGVPVNLPSHGHGQGYTDLNFLIPELIETVHFRKGVYYADLGDFSSAGGVNIETFDQLPQGIAQLEGGMFGYARGLLADSQPLGPGSLLYAAEIFHNDGPWEHEGDFWKGNALLRYSQGDDAMGGSLTASVYAGDWDATDQIAKRALELPGFGRWDSLDTTTGGDSQKYSLTGEWHRRSEASASEALVFGFYQNLDLFSNFTYFLDSPDGDQFEQIDRRWVGGARAHHTLFGRLFEREMENTAGLQLRSDSIRNGLFSTIRRHRRVKDDYEGGSIPSRTRRDDVWELSLAPYLENRVEWTDWLRSVAGVRLDWFHFDVDGADGTASGREDDAMASPKGSLIFGPWLDSELYLSGGMGFHSNDARGVTATFDSADPLVRTYGAEVGVRTTFVPGLQTTLAFWWLDIDDELLFIGDAGTTESTRPSRRYGIELANYYSVTPWLTLDADFALSHARFRDHVPGEGDHIPGAVETVVAAGASVHDLAGFFGALRLRYFGPRPLLEDGSQSSGETILVSTRIGYELTDTWSVSAEIFNLLDRDDHEIDYFYASRLQTEPAGPDDGGFDDDHFHPVDPISVRGVLTARF